MLHSEIDLLEKIYKLAYEVKKPKSEEDEKKQEELCKKYINLKEVKDRNKEGVENLYEYYEKYYKPTSNFRILITIFILLVLIIGFYLVFK